MSQLPDGNAAMEALIESAVRIPTAFRAAGGAVTFAQVSEALDPFISEERASRIEAVIASRARGVAVVVDGLANSGNVAAVMRTAEGLGYLRFDIVTGQAPYKHSARTTQGTEKWLDVHVWARATACVRNLKEAGYRVIATHLGPNAKPLGEIDFTQRTALVFGNELGGVSGELLAEADGTCVIPMSGFAQSFNISVAAATCLYHAREDRIRRSGSHGDLTDEEREWLRAAYRMRSVSRAQSILDRTFAP